MEIEQVKSLKAMVQEILNNIKEIANKKPEVKIGESSVQSFNSILRQVHSIEELKDNPVIREMKSMSIASPTEPESLFKAPKTVDLVTNLSVINGALSNYLRKHLPLRRGGMEQP